MCIEQCSYGKCVSTTQNNMRLLSEMHPVAGIMHFWGKIRQRHVFISWHIYIYMFCVHIPVNSAFLLVFVRWDHLCHIPNHTSLQSVSGVIIIKSSFIATYTKNYFRRVVIVFTQKHPPYIDQCTFTIYHCVSTSAMCVLHPCVCVSV